MPILDRNRSSAKFCNPRKSAHFKESFMKTTEKNHNRSDNLDPITDEPGSHPVGTGVGAVLGGAAAGAATGTVAGPVGTVIGAAAGAIAGGLAGKGVAEAIDPTREDAYWRENYAQRSYVSAGSSYDDYGPAYRYGVSAYSRHPGRSFDQAETDLSRGWKSERGNSSLDWSRAKDPARDAWNRLDNSKQP
jgi:hypothetical protein